MHKRNVRRNRDESSSAFPSLLSIESGITATVLTSAAMGSSSSSSNNNVNSICVPNLSSYSFSSSGCSSNSSNSCNSSTTSSSSEEAKLLSESSDRMDRKLFLSIAALLTFASFSVIASAFGMMLRHIRRGGAFVKPNSNAFATIPIRGALSSSFWDTEDHSSDTVIYSDIVSNTNNTTRAIPKNLIFVTDRLPGDAKIDPHILENAVLWQEMYKDDYKIHFFPGSDSIVKFFESEAPHLLEALKNCESIYEEFDFARYVILYYLGGLSVDIAVTRPLDRLDTLLNNLNPLLEKQQLVAAVDYDFSHADDAKLWAYPRQQGLCTHVWAVTPKHPILLKVIDRVSSHLLDRDSVDKKILENGYPSSVLQNAQKAKLLRRTWTTGSGPFSDILLNAVKEQKTNPSNDQIYQVIILPMETFMSAHPGGMRFRNIQHSRDHSHLIYMGEEDNDTTSNRNLIMKETVSRDGFMINNFQNKIDYNIIDILLTSENNAKVASIVGEGHLPIESANRVDLATAAVADPLAPEPSQRHEHGGSPANLNPKKQQKLLKGVNNLPMTAKTTDLRWKNYMVYDESHLKVSHHAISPYTYLIGAVRDASQIADTPFEYIVQLSCEHGVHVHIVVGGGVEECRARFEKLVKEKYSIAGIDKCGRFELLGEPNDLHSLDNRVDRIAYLRDFQREHLRVVLENGNQDDIVVVADVDLYALPPVSKLMREVNRMRQLHEYDVLCSNGLMHRPNGYYDIYATVLLPDTFLYPVQHRLLGKSWEGEDLTLVRSHDEFGEVTSWDILDWIEQQGEKKKKENAANHESSIEVNHQEQVNPLWTKAKSQGAYSEERDFEPSSAVSVRSCFGGLTIYSAKALLEPSCRYHPPSVGDEADRLLKYANRDDKRPCEHVVYHDCLYRLHTKGGGTSRIAIQPDMKTMWNNIPPPTSKLISDSQQDSLITFVNQVDRADRLTSPNGLFNLYIDGSGILVIESCAIKNCPIPQMRRISSYTFDKERNTTAKKNLPTKNWTHMFLILESNANLILLKQVPKRNLKNNGKGCGLRDDESCQLEVWSSDTAVPGVKQSCDESFFSALEKENKLQRYELDLKNDGYLEISPFKSQADGSPASITRVWRSNGIEY